MCIHLKKNPQNALSFGSKLSPFVTNTPKETVEIDCQTNRDGFTAAAASHTFTQTNGKLLPFSIFQDENLKLYVDQIFFSEYRIKENLTVLFNPISNCVVFNMLIV
ncbi:hypothetical protein DERP_009173 [Dermatophagoides pteronyssinus]|uniref:Uncharacterized protein n=1 Tax=Dermatophagoides pteronyssinus TaxID=6956 RepID=A0ABQ8JR84_DERPT|nr:hypothetical protein DERP_009173 [Dermatophagoides pteronyssinus]